MSELDPVHDAVERLEWADSKEEETPATRFRALTRRAALTGGAAGLAASLLSACGGGGGNPSKGTATASAQAGGGEVFAVNSKQKYVLVNHVTTNPFFVPTKYGAEDACKLLGCSYQWTGSENSNVNEMVNAMNSAVTGGGPGLAPGPVDAQGLNHPPPPPPEGQNP